MSVDAAPRPGTVRPVGGRRTRPPPRVDIPIAGSLLSSAMNEIAQAIANRQSAIDRLQAEIKALTDVDKILGTSAPRRLTRLEKRAMSEITAT